MRLANILLIARRMLAIGVVELSVIAWFVPGGLLIAMLAYGLLVLLVFAYLFEVAYYSIGRTRVRWEL